MWRLEKELTESKITYVYSFMFLLTLPLKILGLTGTIILVAVLYWLFIGSGMSFNQGNNVCAQVITKAKNPISGVIREFSNPCKVPIGWEKIQQENLL